MFKLNIVSGNPSHLSKEVLEKYGVGSTFVETGTYMGDTVKLALESGFTNIDSIELNEGLANKAKEMFKENEGVKIWLGDSVDCLQEIVNGLTEPSTFWLDAHASGPLQGGKTGGGPVVDELRIIATSPIKDHTIFIDDKRLFGSAEWSFTREEDAMAVLKEINPNYNIVYLDGEIPGDVICATVK